EDWIKLWPSYAHNGKFVRALAESIGLEFNRIARARKLVQDQLFVHTATWGLKYWEQMLELPLRTDTDWHDRRTQIYAALVADGKGKELDRLAAVLAGEPLCLGEFQRGLERLTGVPSALTV